MKNRFNKISWKNILTWVLVVALLLGICALAISCTDSNDKIEDNKQTTDDITDTDNGDKEETPDETTSDNDNTETPTPKPDDKTPEQPSAPSEEELKAIAYQKLEAEIKAKFGASSTWKIDEDASVFYCYELNAGNASLYSAALSQKPSMETAENIDNITADIKAMEKTPLATFAFSDKNLKYKGYEYNMGAIKGANPFAEKLGITSENIVTSLEANLSNNVLNLDISVLAGNKTTLGRVSTEVEDVEKLENYENLTESEKKAYDLETLKKLTEDYGNLSESDQRKYSDSLFSKLLDEGNTAEVEAITFGIQNLSGISALTPTRLPEIEDPTPVEKDKPTEEDYAALEKKLNEIGNEIKRMFELNEVLEYSVNEGDFYLVVDLSRGSYNQVNVYKAEGNFDLTTKEGIKKTIDSLTADQFIELASLQKASADITVNGETYSKDGIEGDNPFARVCGVENARLTYVSNTDRPTLTPESSTHYGAGYSVLIVYNQNGKDQILSQNILVECDGYATQDEIIKNSFDGNKFLRGELKINDPIILGENLNNQSEKSL